MTLDSMTVELTTVEARDIEKALSDLAFICSAAGRKSRADYYRDLALRFSS